MRVYMYLNVELVQDMDDWTCILYTSMLQSHGIVVYIITDAGLGIQMYVNLYIIMYRVVGVVERCGWYSVDAGVAGVAGVGGEWTWV